MIAGREDIIRSHWCYAYHKYGGVEYNFVREIFEFFNNLVTYRTRFRIIIKGISFPLIHRELEAIEKNEKKENSGHYS